MINKLFPVMNAIDIGLSSVLPQLARICLWGALAGGLSIAVYARISPQTSITELKKKANDLRHRLLDVDLAFTEFLRLSKENVKTSLRLLSVVIGPAIISAFPVLFLATWMHTTQGFEAPPSHETLSVMAVEGDINIQLNGFTDADRSLSTESPSYKEKSNFKIVVKADGKTVYSGYPLTPPTPFIYKKKWWNYFFDNPAGYLSEDAPMESIRLNISKRRFVKWMPEWGEGWEFPFFGFVFLIAFGIKVAFRIE
jgi:hypothetical protein